VPDELGESFTTWCAPHAAIRNERDALKADNERLRKARNAPCDDREHGLEVSRVYAAMANLNPWIKHEITNKPDDPCEGCNRREELQAAVVAVCGGDA